VDAMFERRLGKKNEERQHTEHAHKTRPQNTHTKHAHNTNRGLGRRRPLSYLRIGIGSPLTYKRNTTSSTRRHQADFGAKMLAQQSGVGMIA